MRVLLLNPPGDRRYLRDYYCSHTSKARYFWHPLDLLYQSGIMGLTHEIVGLDANVQMLTHEEAGRRVRELNPDAILFLTGGVSWRQDFEFLESLQPPASMPIIGTGDIMTAKRREMLERFPWISAVLTDFTSDSAARFFKCWDTERAGIVDDDEFPQLTYRLGDEIKVGPSNRVRNFDIPLPRYDLFPWKMYRIPHGRRRYFASVLTDYGCPFTCSFCFSGTIAHKTRDMDNLMAELRYVHSLGIRELWVKDLTFGVNRKHTLEFLQRLEAENFGFSWVTLSRVDVVNEDLLERMARTGCHTIQFGVESADPNLLDSIDKRIAPDRVEEIFALCRRLGIRTLAHFILGLPGETEESALHTIEFAKQIEPDFVSFNIATPKMGTRLREEAIEKGWTSPEVDVLDNSAATPVLDTGQLSPERVWALRNRAIKEFHLRPSYIGRKLLSISSPGELWRMAMNAYALLESTLVKPTSRAKRIEESETSLS